MARVERIVDRLRREHGDRRGREMGVDRLAQPATLPGPREIDMRDLAGRVDARIRAAGAMRDDRRAGQRQHRPLDGRAVGLSLPADERRAVIFDRQLVARHGCEGLRPVRPSGAARARR
jgi:hypothetical protein